MCSRDPSQDGRPFTLENLEVCEEPSQAAGRRGAATLVARPSSQARREHEKEEKARQDEAEAAERKMREVS